MSRSLRVALVHDWLTGERGGEQVLAQLCRMYPAADIYTLVYRPGSVGAPVSQHCITPSILQRLTRSKGGFRHWLPLFGRIIERFDLTAYELVISTSHCVAHGVRTQPHQRHIAYIHTPMRYLYDQMPSYLPRLMRPWGVRPVQTMTAPLRRWDRRAAQRPARLVANSKFVAARIERVWDRSAEVVYPPVEQMPSGLGPAPVRRGLLFVGALVPYKRAELAIALAARMRTPLRIVGSGPQQAALRRIAPPWVHFVHGLSRAELWQHYRSAEALVFVGEEDFGMAPVEAMAAGTPVLGVGYGGLCETVVTTGPHPTGTLAPTPSLDALEAAYLRLLAMRRAHAFDASALQRHAARFSAQHFEQGMGRLVVGLGLPAPARLSLAPGQARR